MSARSAAGTGGCGLRRRRGRDERSSPGNGTRSACGVDGRLTAVVRSFGVQSGRSRYAWPRRLLPGEFRHLYRALSRAADALVRRALSAFPRSTASVRSLGLAGRRAGAAGGRRGQHPALLTSAPADSEGMSACGSTSDGVDEPDAAPGPRAPALVK
jgi:hypothetical protein